MPHITIDGNRIYYEDQGRGEPVVFVHGWGASSRFWRMTLPELSKSYRCLAPDLIGFGDSDKPHRDYSLPELARFVGRFLDVMNLPSVTLVGHSIGGAISIMVALGHPERVKRLVLVNAPVLGSTALFRRSLFLLMPGIRWLAFALSRQRFIRDLIARNFSYAARLAFDLVEDLTKGTYRSTVEPILSLRRTDLSGRLSGIACPTLVMYTDADTIIKMKQFQIQIRRIPRAETALLSGTGHIPMLEDAEGFNRHLKSWLDQKLHFH